jgi:hypothetical protein
MRKALFRLRSFRVAKVPTRSVCGTVGVVDMGIPRASSAPSRRCRFFEHLRGAG